jgi:uncharacterized protein with HEPN domain
VRDDRARLEDILRAISSIERYAGRGGRAAFDRDELIQSWMVYHLTLIGEAAARLSPALRESHPAVPWPGLIGMRNVLVHGYFAVDLAEVWATVERRVPILREQVEAIMLDLGSDQAPTVSEPLHPYRLAIR